MRAEFVKLSWQLLEWRLLYYNIGRYKQEPPEDWEYDQVEKRYKELCKELGEPEYTLETVEPDFSRPSTRLADAKLRGVPFDERYIDKYKE